MALEGIITMITIPLLIWGGFLYMLYKAFIHEKNKMSENGKS